MANNLIICDTNIWMNKLFESIKVGNILYIRGYYEDAKKITNKFQQLTNEGHKLVMTQTIYNELSRTNRDYFLYLSGKKNIYKHNSKAIKQVKGKVA